MPAALGYMPYYYYKDTPDAPIIQPISTGMACHCSLAEAAVSAVCEVVERDAFTITWQARLAHPQIPVESLSDSNYELVRRFEWTRASVSLFNITLDAGIPTVLAALFSPSPRTPRDFCRRRFPEFLRPPSGAAWRSWHITARDTAADHQLAAPVHPVPARSRERGGSGHAPELLVRSRQRPPGRLPWASKKRFDFGKYSGCQRRPRGRLEGPVREDSGRQPPGPAGGPHQPRRAPAGPVGGVRCLPPGFHPLCMGYKIRALGGRRLWEVPHAPGLCGIVPDSGDNPAPHPYP